MKVWIVSDCLPGLIEAWEKNGYDVVVNSESLENCSYSNVLEMMDIMRRIENIQMVFSYNFIPQISDACEKHNLKYISWIIDSYNVQLLTKSVFNSANRIVSFDYVQYNMMIMRGVKYAYYLPIHVSSYAYRSIIERNRKKRQYLNDVSYVDTLYDIIPYDLYDYIRDLPEFLQGYIDAAIDAQRCIWGENIIDKVINDRVISEVKNYVSLQIPENAISGYYGELFKEILHARITQLEKKELCNELSAGYDFGEYKVQKPINDPSANISFKEYYNDNPLIFSDSRINVNHSPHSIESGIPLKVMDILACGGFCLTNYQAEIVEYFEDGKDLVIYTDFNDMYDKVDFYLKNESKRMEIACSGQKKVMELFDLYDGIGKLLQMIL